MNKYLPLLVIAFLAVFGRTEAFFDLIQTYSKRNMAIKSLIISTLEERGEKIKWKAIAHGYPDEVQVDFVFVPECDSHESWYERVTYSELNLEKDDQPNTFEDLYGRLKGNAEDVYPEYKLLQKSPKEIRDEAYKENSKPKHMIRIIRRVGELKYQILIYQVKGSNLTEEEKGSWFKTLESFRIKY